MKNHIKNKKAVSFNLLYTGIARLSFLIAILIICVVLFSLFLKSRLDFLDLQAEVLVEGLIYGTGGITYFDPVTGRVYPTLIDLNQVNESNLMHSLHYPNNNFISAKITVEDKDTKPIREYYFNKKWYRNWEPLLRLAYLPGIGGVTDYHKVLPTTYRDESGEIKTGYVHFHVVQPKSPAEE
jgi:hypothetical protein